MLHYEIITYITEYCWKKTYLQNEYQRMILKQVEVSNAAFEMPTQETLQNHIQLSDFESAIITKISNQRVEKICLQLEQKFLSYENWD